VFGYVQKLGDFDAAARARVRTERRCGELLKDMEKAKGNQYVNSAKSNGATKQTQTLKELGVTKNQRQQDAGMIINMVQTYLV